MNTASFERWSEEEGQHEGLVLGGTYVLGRRIGRGGMGEVFEASHTRLPGRFAVKLLLPELVGNREAFARFCREAEIMSELRHPNIVQIFDFNTGPDGRPYFVMEHLEGRDLEARLEDEKRLPLPAIVRVVNAVSSALAAAHTHGVVHRDLKPSNIFLAAIDGQTDELVKVLDFGISKIRAASTRLSLSTEMLGTPSYMSPEQAQGRLDEVDGRTDQFALGAIAYRMLTGQEPFKGDDNAAILYQVVHEEPAPLGSLLPANWDPVPLQIVLAKALAKDADQRFGGMMELARAFEDAAERTIGHAPSRAASTEAPPVRLNPTVRIVAPSVISTPAIALEDEDLDRIPMTHHRAAALGVVALGLAGTLVATGWYREVPDALRFTRDNVVRWARRPTVLPQPEALAERAGEALPAAPVPAPPATSPAPAPAVTTETTAESNPVASTKEDEPRSSPAGSGSHRHQPRRSEVSVWESPGVIRLDGVRTPSSDSGGGDRTTPDRAPEPSAVAPAPFSATTPAPFQSTPAAPQVPTRDLTPARAGSGDDVLPPSTP